MEGEVVCVHIVKAYDRVELSSLMSAPDGGDLSASYCSHLTRWEIFHSSN